MYSLSALNDDVDLVSGFLSRPSLGPDLFISPPLISLSHLLISLNISSLPMPFTFLFHLSSGTVLSFSAVDQSGSVGSGQPLVNAIRTDSALIGGVIAVVIFVIVTGLAVTARFLYRRKETYRNRDVRGVKQEESPDFPFNNQTDSQNVSSENPKEYFI
uniref:Neurexin/syndecan/glycophorin C domain-containing protein n=1 Tax=Anabas testudineus TaxID=64144 RepID=A0A7N6BE81_ANATE